MYSLAKGDLLQNFYFTSFLHIMALHDVSTPETEMHDVQLLKNDLGLGITVAGYVCDEENISGIFIKDICSGSAADLTGNIQINDRIVKVNGKSVTALNNYEAIEILRESGPTVIISLERYLRGPKYERLQQSVCSNPALSPAEEAKSVFMFFNNADERSSQQRKQCLNMTPQNTEDEKLAGVSLNDNISDISKFLLKTEPPEKYSRILPPVVGENLNIRNINLERRDILIHVAADTSRLDELCSHDVPQTNEEKHNFDHVTCTVEEEFDKISQLVIKADSSLNTDSSCIYFSKTSDDTEKDGYETCIDESLSDEICTKHLTEAIYDNVEPETISDLNDNGSATRISDILKPVALNKYFNNVFSNSNLNTASSEPSLSANNGNLVSTRDCIKWNSYTGDNTKTFRKPSNTETNDVYVIQSIENADIYKFSDNVKQSEEDNLYAPPSSVTYKCLRLQEYYNDYEDCLEDYNIILKNQDEIIPNTSETDENKKYPNLYAEDALNDNMFELQKLLFKSYSEPYILDNLYRSDYIQSFGRRFSLVSDNRNYATMTVTSKQINLKPEKKGDVNNDFEMHWGSIKNIEIYRETNDSLGITIVCGKVDLYTADTELGTTSGIFIKHIAVNSAAGRTGQFHVGDRILEVDGIDIRNAGHEEAIASIRNAGNVISFVVQSLTPLSKLNHSENAENVESQTQVDNLNNEIGFPGNDVDKSYTNTNDANKLEDSLSIKVDEDINKHHEEQVNNENDKELEDQVAEETTQEIDRSSAEKFKGSKEETDSIEEDEFGYTIDKPKMAVAVVSKSEDPGKDEY